MCSGSCERDDDGDYTYLGVRENTVIDYVIINAKECEKKGKAGVQKKTGSDHLPIVYTWVEEEEEEKERGE